MLRNISYSRKPIKMQIYTQLYSFAFAYVQFWMNLRSYLHVDICSYISTFLFIISTSQKGSFCLLHIGRNFQRNPTERE